MSIECSFFREIELESSQYKTSRAMCKIFQVMLERNPIGFIWYHDILYACNSVVEVHQETLKYLYPFIHHYFYVRFSLIFL